MSARFVIADVFEGLASLPDDSVDLVLSSPPFLALRSYLPPGHPTKAKEIGSEATPADFLDTLLDVVEACGRVLAPHGSLVFELGDTYAGSGGGGGDYLPGGLREGQPGFAGSACASRDEQREANATHWRQKNRARSPRPKYQPDVPGPRSDRAADEADSIIPPRSHSRAVRPGWPLDKSLTGVPTLFAWSLAYGRNLLRPERTTEPWIVRNLVAWCRPNPPVGALADKFRPATSYLTVATRARDRYFDGEAVRERGSANTHPRLSERVSRGRGRRPNEGKAAHDERRGGHVSTLAIEDGDGTAPLTDRWWFNDVFEQDAWEIPTQPYKGSHYATWPKALLTRPILAMCPERVCTVCGEPSRRLVEVVNASGKASVRNRSMADRSDGPTVSTEHPDFSDRRTVGWTICGHGAWRRGVVLDPFAGSGTTLEVATGHGRDAVGIDLDGRNADLARERVGMWLAVEHLAEGVSA